MANKTGISEERDLAIIRTMRVLVTQGRNSETDQQLAERALSLAELYHGGALMDEIKAGVMTALDFYSYLSAHAIRIMKFFFDYVERRDEVKGDNEEYYFATGAQLVETACQWQKFEGKQF